MKSLIVIFTVLSCFRLAAQPINQMDTKGKKQGKWEKYYPKSKVIEYKGQFRDGKPIGTFTYYYPSNRLKAEIRHDEKTGRSVAVMYHESGVVFAKGIYRNQLKDSIWDYFGPSGRQSLKETYVNDKLHGRSTVYYVPEDPGDRTMRIAKVSNYVKGVLEGEVTEYFDSGTVKSKGTYLNGKLHGTYTINHPNGKTMILERYKNGARHGWCATYDGNGKELGRKYFYHGRELEGKELETKMRQLKELGINPND